MVRRDGTGIACGGAVEFLFTTPERLAQPGFLEELRRTPIDLFVVVREKSQTTFLDSPQARRGAAGNHEALASFQITFDERRAVVELRLSPLMSAAEHVRARTELVAVCRERGIRRVLVDARELAEQPTPAELFDFGSAWPALLRQTAVVVAGVLPKDANVRRWWRFGEDVAVNRGLISHAFETVDEARAWLARW